MSSDLCKKAVTQKCPTGQTWDGTKCVKNDTKTPLSIPGCMDPKALNYSKDATKSDGSCKYAKPSISGKSLRSKHLKIISEDLYDDGSPASNVVDPIRGDFFNHYGPSLNEFKRTYSTRDFTTGLTPDEMYYDVPANEEAKAEGIFKSNNMKDKEFTYINFTLNVPFDEREVRANSIQSGRPNQDDPGFTGADPRISTYKFEPRYNFYSKAYEDKVLDAAVEERSIPNSSMYHFLVESLYDKDVNNYDTQYLNLLAYTYGGLSLAAALKTGIVKHKYNYNTYLEDYIVPIVNLKSDSVKAAHRDKFNNLVVAQDDVLEYNQFVENDRSAAFYGFYLEVPFETPKLDGAEEHDEFKKIFKLTNTDLQMYSIVKNSGTSGNQSCYIGERYIESTTNTPVINFSNSSEKIKSWDITNHFSNHGKFMKGLEDAGQSYLDAFNLTNDKHVTILGETNEAIQKYKDNSTYDFFKDLMAKTANAKFKDIIKKKSLTPVDLFGAYGLSETPYEVLFYRIEKKDLDGNVLQNYYIPNPFEETQFKDKIVKFFDSQVKYGKKYFYDVYAYPLVLAKKYHYITKIDETRFTAALSWKYYVIFNYFKALLTLYSPGIKANVRNAIKALPSNSPFEQDVLTGLNALKSGLLGSIDKVFGKYTTLKSKQYVKHSFAFKKEMIDFVNKFIEVGTNELIGTTINNMAQLASFVDKIIAKWMTFMTGRAAGSWDYSSGTFLRRYATKGDPTKRELIDQVIEWTLSESAARQNKKVSELQLTTAQLDMVEATAVQGTTQLGQVWGKISSDLMIAMFTPTHGITFDKSTSTQVIDVLIKAMSGIYEDEFGNKPGSTDMTGTEFDAFQIITEDYIPLMEIPLFSVNGKILDSPPVSPSISFVPFKDVDNRIAIKIKSQNTQYYAKPEAITNQDDTEIQNMINTRGTDKQGRLLYKTDDYLSRFEAYRMEERPKSYKDFAPHLRKRIDLEGKYSSFTLNDKIEANKKYYYTFRSFDVHGHYSNPTPVYEFILNNDGGFLYPEIRIVDFEVSDYFEFSKTMQKYIQIKPSAQNVILNPELIKNKQSARDLECENKASVPPPLGVASNAVWGKNFKLRITSKTSGKKIDVNFNFEKNHKRE